MPQLSIARYEQLIRAEQELLALEDAGVDNWPGRDNIDWDEVEKNIETLVEAVR